MDFGRLVAEYGDDFVSLLVQLIPKLAELFQKGGRDAVLVALDSALDTARAVHDVELDRKHGR